jgi:hypothetical protein
MNIRRKLAAALGICTVLTLGIAVPPVGAVSTTSYDGHWSGLVDRAGSYLAVTGTFKAPKAATGCGTTALGAVFIGLGGYGQLPFTQVGVSFSPAGYGIFTETFDAVGHDTLKSIAIPVRAGDTLALGLAFTKSHTVLEYRVRNVTTGRVTSQWITNASRFWNGSSAEWVVERPNSNSLLPYGTVGISNAKALRGATWFAANTAPDTSIVLLGAAGNQLSRLSAASGTSLVTTWLGCH